MTTFFRSGRRHSHARHIPVLQKQGDRLIVDITGITGELLERFGMNKRNIVLRANRKPHGRLAGIFRRRAEMD